MAYYSKVHLKDEASEAFLSSRGFVLVSTCSQLSYWLNSNIELFLPVDTLISSDIDIYSKISSDYYKLGIKAGKRTALTSITNSLSELVFPNEPANNQDY